MRVVAVLLLLVAACNAPDGAACEEWSDCESEVCGSGVCLGSECPCEDGWTCTPGNCGAFSLACDGQCRQLCATDDDCPVEQKCRGVADVEGTVCVYEVPDVVIDPGGPYVAMMGEPIELRAVVALADGYAIDHGSWGFPTSAASLDHIGDARIEGNTLIATIVFWYPFDRAHVSVTTIDPRSAEEWNDQFKSTASDTAPLELSCAPAGAACKSWESCCSGLRCYDDTGDDLRGPREGVYGTCKTPTAR